MISSTRLDNIIWKITSGKVPPASSIALVQAIKWSGMVSATVPSKSKRYALKDVDGGSGDGMSNAMCYFSLYIEKVILYYVVKKEKEEKERKRKKILWRSRKWLGK